MRAILIVIILLALYLLVRRIFTTTLQVFGLTFNPLALIYVIIALYVLTRKVN